MLSPASRLMRRTRDRSASREADSATESFVMVLSCEGLRGLDASRREGRKNGAFSGALGASFGLFRCYIAQGHYVRFP